MSEATQSIVTKTGSRLIAVRISEADKARAGVEIAEHLQAIIGAKDRGKTFASKIKEETDRREKQIEVLRLVLTTGTEQRQIPCEYQYDYDHARVTIIRLDTDPPEELDTRAMTTDEFRLTRDAVPEEPLAEQGESHEPEREPPPWEAEGEGPPEGAIPPNETSDANEPLEEPHEQGGLDDLPEFGAEPAEEIPATDWREVYEEEPDPPAPGGPEGDPDSAPLGPVSDPAVEHPKTTPVKRGGKKK